MGRKIKHIVQLALNEREELFKLIKKTKVANSMH